MQGIGNFVHRINGVGWTTHQRPHAATTINQALGYLYGNGLTGFKWFNSADEYFVWDRAVAPAQAEVEGHINAGKAFDGYCRLCNRGTVFKVDSGILLNGHNHLREGMFCGHCHIHNRGRLLGLAILSQCQTIDPASQLLLMESTTPLFRLLKQRLSNLIGSEYVGPSVAEGETVLVNGNAVRHESILGLSFPDRSLKLIAHADVLEHVPDVEQALAECVRTLEPGGHLTFSAPFSQDAAVSKKLATLTSSGEIEHLVSPPEYHGSHLAFYQYGWDLLDYCKSAGFSKVSVGVCFDPLQGLLSTGRFGGYFMQPLVISCVR